MRRLLMAAAAEVAREVSRWLDGKALAHAEHHTN
jgi:hypothetical protein